jgi:peptidyl-prolyl cis-trans isomerase C
MRYSLLHATVLGVLLVGVSACQQDAATDASAPEPDKVVARVNGEAIGQATVESQVQALSARGQQVSPSRALDEVITVKLLAQKAEEKGLADKPEVQIELDRQRSSLLAQQLIREELNAFEPSEENLRAAYDEQFASADGNMEYHARHILLKEDKAKAEAIIEQLNGGADFVALAKEQSEGPSASNGGDLGWFQPSDMVQPFSEAVQSLEPGQYTKTPVKTQFGWHVALLEETRAAEPPQFEEVRSQLRSQLVSQHLQQYIADLRQSGDVEIVDEGMAAGSGNQDGDPAAGDSASESGDQ